MKIYLIVFLSSYLTQACISTNTEHATKKLKELEGFAHEKLDNFFLEHSKLSSQIDPINQDTKNRIFEEIEDRFNTSSKYKQPQERALQQLKQFHLNDFVYCVHQQSNDGLNALSTKIFMKKKMNVVLCQADVDCLKNVVRNVTEKFHGVTKLVDGEITSSKFKAEAIMVSIRNCASRTIVGIEFALGNVHKCEC